jgi:hypothetical protein
VNFQNPTIKLAINIWLAVIDLAGLITVYEIAAINYHWWHTISYLSFTHHWLGWGIAVMMGSVIVWWIKHFHERHYQ